METSNDIQPYSLHHTKEKEIKEVYENWKKAVISNDADFLENLYSDDFLSWSPMGIIKNKSEILVRLGFKDVRYLCWNDKTVAINIEGENATLKSLQTLHIELYTLPIKIEREIILLFKNLDGRWLLKNIKENSI